MLLLTGISGSGKSKVGREIARKLHLKFVDTDRLIEEIEGMQVAHIFERHGEKYFRKLEKKVIEDLMNEDEVCVALGGGAVTVPEVRNRIKKKKCGVD